MRRLLLSLLLVLPLGAFASQISVPSAPGAGYGLTSVSTGQYVASTTNRLLSGTGITFTGGSPYIFGPQVTISAATASSTLLSDFNTFSNIITGSITGNAGTASALSPGANINGIPFTGAGNITINAASSSALTDSNTFAGALTSFSNTIKVASLSGLVGANAGTLYGFSSTSLFGYIPVQTVTATAPVFSSGGLTPNITWYGLSTTTQPSSSQLLTSNGVNGVYGTGTSTLTASSPLTGSFTQVGSGGSLGCSTASSGVAGCLNTTDWATFNNKISSTSLSASAPLNYTPATGAFTITSASAGVTGALTGTDWTTFNNKTSWPWTINPATSFFGAISNSTTTQEHLSATGISLSASTTAVLSSIVAGSSTAGTIANTTFADAPIAIVGNNANYTQAVVQNLSNGPTASSIFAVHNDLASDSTYYGEFGINSSGYTQAGFGAQNPSDVFVNANDGALVLSTASTTNPTADLRFATGGTASTSIRAVITASGLVGIGTTSPYVSSLTISSSTKSQLALTDGSFPWFQRSIAGTLYIATGSPIASATSSQFALSINPNAGLTIPALGTCTGANALMSNLGVISCGAISGSGSATTTLLTDFNTFGGQNRFTNTLFASSTIWSALTPNASGAFYWNPTASMGAFGSTSPLGGELTIATTAPQLVFGDAQNLNSFMHYERYFAGSWWLGTSSTATGATSTVPDLSINANGGLTVPAIASASGNNCIQTSTTGLLSNTGGACGSPYPFSPFATLSATSTLIQDTGGLLASSTVRFGNATTANFNWSSAGGFLGVGTTTPLWTLTVASTSPQIGLDDAQGLGMNQWTLRAIAGNFYLATASPLTRATSTVSVLSIVSSIFRISADFIVNTGYSMAFGTTTPGVWYGNKSGVTIATTTALIGGQLSVGTASTTCNGVCTVNWDTGNTQIIHLSNNATLVINSTSSNPRDGAYYDAVTCQDATGGRTVNWGTPINLRWGTLGTTTVGSTLNTCTHTLFSYSNQFGSTGTGIYHALASSTNLLNQ